MTLVSLAWACGACGYSLSGNVYKESMGDMCFVLEDIAYNSGAVVHVGTVRSEIVEAFHSEFDTSCRDSDTKIPVSLLSFSTTAGNFAYNNAPNTPRVARQNITLRTIWRFGDAVQRSVDTQSSMTIPWVQQADARGQYMLAGFVELAHKNLSQVAGKFRLIMHEYENPIPLEPAAQAVSAETAAEQREP